MNDRRPIMMLATMALWAGAAMAEPRLVTPDHLALEDADTLQVEVAGSTYRIQLPGIDAPENTVNPKLQRDLERTGLDEASLLGLGRAADEGLQTLLAGFSPYRLRFDPDARDRYGRTPGDLLDADGRTLSERLVEAGYAIPVGVGTPLDGALQAARQAGRGLWGSHPALIEAWAARPVL